MSIKLDVNNGHFALRAARQSSDFALAICSTYLIIIIIISRIQNFYPDT